MPLDYNRRLAGQPAIVVQGHSAPLSAPVGVGHHPDSGAPVISAGQGPQRPECTGKDGQPAILLFVPGLVLMILGTNFVGINDAPYALCITGGSLILAALVYHLIYRLTLGANDFAAPKSSCCVRLVAYLLCAANYAFWLTLAVNPMLGTYEPVRYVCFGTDVSWALAFRLLWWESEKCRMAVLDRLPIEMSKASVTQLVDAMRSYGEPYFTASVIACLQERHVDGIVLIAILQAEQTACPDTEHARNFLDQLLGDLSTHHKIASKQIMRGWISSGVPQPSPPHRPLDRQRNQEMENRNVIFLSPVPSISKG